MLGDPLRFGLLPDHEAGDVLQEQQRDVALAAQLDEVRAFLRRIAEQDAVIGDDADWIAVDVREAGDQRGAVELLELVELGTVDETGDHLAGIVGFLQVGADDAVQLLGRVERGDRRTQGRGRLFAPVQVGDAAAGDLQRMGIVLGIVIGHAGGAAVHIGTAQILGADHLAGGGFDQRRAGQEDGALVAHDDRLVGHRRHIGPAGGAQPHHHGDLRDPLGGHARLVVEDAAEVIAIRKHLVLLRQVGAAGVDQVDAGQVVTFGDLLGAQVFLRRQRVVGPPLPGGVVGDDHALDAADPADTGDDAGGRNIVVVNLVGGQLG